MNNTNNLLVVKSENKELLTQEEMAAKLGLATSTVCKWIARMGLEPAVPANRKMGVAAKYDTQAFFNLQEEEEARKLKEKEQQLIAKHVNALSIDERETVVRETLDSLSAKDTMRLALEAAQVAMMKLRDEQEEQQFKLDTLEVENTELKRQLDCEQNTGTLEKFNEEYNWHATAVQLSVLSRRLGKHYTRTRAISIEHPDGVWSYKRSDVLDSITRFPQFWEGIL